METESGFANISSSDVEGLTTLLSQACSGVRAYSPTKGASPNRTSYGGIEVALPVMIEQVFMTKHASDSYDKWLVYWVPSLIDRLAGTLFSVYRD